MQPTDYLFVYGLLMSDAEPEVELMVWSNVRMIGEATVAGVLYDAGPFPAAVPGEGVIHGRVLAHTKRNAWPVLDNFEGVNHDPPLFRRGKTVATVGTTKYDCWIYWYARDTDKLPRIESGRWRG